MSLVDIAANMEGHAALARRETQLQQLVTAYIVAGLLFLLLPGTFLGVWNLLAISADHTVTSLSPAWLQAHGHAQMFGWLGTFILGIGFYSLSKMGNLKPFAVSRGWLAFGFWTGGASLRWLANVTAWQWRVVLPFSALLELAGFLLFFFTVVSHRRPLAPGTHRKKDPWMIVVTGGAIAFLATLLVNLGSTIYVALCGDSPAVDFRFDQRLLLLPMWGFLVPTVWGFNARWLPTFIGLRPVRASLLYAAMLTAWAGVLLMQCRLVLLSSLCLPVAAMLAISGLGVFDRPVQAAKLNGVHRSFPIFIRVAYIWLFIASLLSVIASLADREGGIWGASRHALTVGFLAVMVFSIGPKILPAFCGARILFSPRLMFLSLVLLNAGCLARVCAEIAAYEGYVSGAWSVLPWSAMIEFAAVTVFALNLGVTFLRPPAHLMRAKASC
jgi:uncharacterized protein involved in response to NO